MAKKKAKPEELDNGERIVLANALPGIPEGTMGKVTFVAGFSWIRYWVRFENGVIRGSLNRKNLARPEEWIEIQARRARGDDQPKAAEPAAVAAAPSSDGGDGGGSTAGAGLVPEHLLERSRARRAALGK